ncbi:U7 snRNA-associated Sm-like protein LSm11 isoform X2 [Meriones unguiculatus]|uniref:U7 snRNA-associated Sm-like protein LSm11 isoform X2 n=1 Tax=Meriones unguiculatus TaxID=10047 RepID=UPI00293EDF62|nr:U7 snRNA-associated Sm-like protein LSm11 isoform X2 [Meriones unguiculatus]
MEEREWGARSARAGSPASPPSPRLDVSSYSFDPLLALYSPHLPPIPYPNAPCFNNVAEYESFLKGGRAGRGRARATGEAASAGTSTGTSTGARTSSKARRRAAPTPDPERIQRLRRLMVVKEDADGAAGARRQGPGRSKKAPRNVLTRMPLHEGSPLGELHRCIREGVKVNVHIRTFKGLRGVCTGFLVAFDKFWNMALTDVDETYRKPVLGKAYERDSSLTLTKCPTGQRNRTRRLAPAPLPSSPCFSAIEIVQSQPVVLSESPDLTAVATEWSGHSRTGCKQAHESNKHL